MKPVTNFNPIRIWALIFGLLSANELLAQRTVFTYQGRLNNGSSPANGTYDLRFALYDAATFGAQQGTTYTNSGTIVSNGLCVAKVDFGNQFSGGDRWLEIGVRTNNLGPFVILSPRQQLTSVPYAIAASNLTGTLPAAQLSGVIPSANLAGTYSGTVTFNNSANSFSGDGGGLTNLNASQLESGTVPIAALSSAWKITGNGGTLPGTHFVGTTDDNALEMRVNRSRAFRLEPTISFSGDSNIVNVIGGSVVNFAGPYAYGVTIAGGGAPSFFGPGTNSVLDSFSTVGGGSGNVVDPGAYSSTIGGGQRNTISTNASRSTIGGGQANNIQSEAQFGTISGGLYNTILLSDPFPWYATIGGGTRNTNASERATIAGGDDNTIQSNAANSVIGGGDFNIIERLGVNGTISGGVANLIKMFAANSVIDGGYSNTIGTSAISSVISGGEQHVNAGSYAVIGGGIANLIGSNALYAAIGGGQQNLISANGQYGTVPGGQQNSATNYAFAAGRRAKANHTGAFVWADSQNADFASTTTNQFLIRASGGVGIGTTNPAANALQVNPTFHPASGYGLSVNKTDNGANIQIARTNGQPGVGLAVENSSLGDASTSLLLIRNNVSASAQTLLNVQADGNIAIGPITPTNRLHVAGGISATAFVNTSDRNAKENFAPVSPQEVLRKVAALPITTWNFRTMDDGRHMGATAQDFYAAFGLGGSASTITSVDPDGVALAAIQGLNEKVELIDKKREQRIQKLEAENTELKKQLQEIKIAIQSLSTKNAD